MRQVLMVSFQFPPTGGAGVQRVTKFVKYLPQYGWNPYVLAVDSMYTSNSPRDDSLLAEISSDTRIERIPTEGFSKWLIHGSMHMKRFRFGRGLIRGLIVPDYDGLWRKPALRAGLRVINGHPVKAIYTTEPISAHWVGYSLHRRTGLPWIMDIRDLWTRSFTYRPVSYLHSLFDSWLEQSLLQAATAVSCVTHGFQQELVSLYGDYNPSKYVVIPNGYDEDDFDNLLPSPYPNNRFTLSYVGSLFDFAVSPRPVGWKRIFEPFLHGDGPAEMVRTPRFLLQAVQTMLTERPDLQERMRVQFIGKIPAASQKMIDELGLSHIVEATGYVPHREAIQYMMDADVLVLMQAGKGSEVVVPGKLYEYLRAGRPILGLFPEGESPSIIRATCAGVVVAPNDVDGIRQQLTDWFTLWDAGQLQHQPDWKVIHSYSRERQAAEFAALLNSVTRVQ